MAKVVLIGGSGFVGSAILKELLGRGHAVTTIVRDVNHVAVRHPKLAVISEDVMDTNRLAAKLSCHDAIISAYNPGWNNPDLYEDIIVGYDSIIYAAEQSGVPRLLIVGGAGGLLLPSGQKLMNAEYIPGFYLPAAQGMDDIYNNYLLPNDRIDWVWFAPAALIDPAPHTAPYRLGKDHLIEDEKGESHISREDYATAMVDELETPAHHRECFTIGY